MRRVDSRLAKHAVASWIGEPLVGFDAESETLYVPLGAELPGLYERAVVGVPGVIPKPDLERAVTTYGATPEDVALRVVGALTN